MPSAEKYYEAPNVADQVITSNQLPEVVVYIEKDFGGAQLRMNLNVVYFPQDTQFNDAISSIIIVSGKWQFFIDSYYNGLASSILGPGYYSTPEAFGLPDDSISSFKCVGI